MHEIASRFLGKWHRARFCDCQDAQRGPLPSRVILNWNICTGRAPTAVDDSYRRQNSCYTTFTCMHACNPEIASRFLGKWHRARFCDCQGAQRGPPPHPPKLGWVRKAVRSRFVTHRVLKIECVIPNLSTPKDSTPSPKLVSTPRRYATSRTTARATPAARH